jgi:spermidine/putrescine transport system substrate-binding protein
MTRPARSRPPLGAGLALPRVGRRGFIRGAAAGGLGLWVPGMLAACGTEGTTQTSDSCQSTDSSDTEKELFFSNWPEYIDVKGKKMPTLEAFEADTGIDVTYNTDINDNNEFFAKVQNQLGACESIERDIIVLTDWMAARLVELGWLQKLDHDNLANVDANLVANLQSPDWDPNRDYSVPWQSGFTGIAYNKKAIDKPVGSFDELLSRPDLSGKVSLLKEMRDTMGFLLKITGADPGDFDQAEWEDAIERLEESVGNGHIRRFTGNDYLQDLAKGDLVAAEAWSGDIMAMGNPDIEWVVPEEGLSLWSDNMLVPNKAEHKANAEALMNHYYQPEVAAELAAWVWYVCPVEGAREAMEQFDPSLVDEPLIFPNEEFLANTFSFMAVDESTARQYDTDFSRAIG